jgi:hypothetical protein
VSAEDGKSLRAEWQRKWRATGDRTAVTIYLTRFEMDVLDYLVWERMREDPRPEAVGRTSALGSLLSEFVDRRRDKVAPWAQGAADPKERASFYHRELGKRRQGPQRGKYELPTEWEQLKREAQSRLKKEERRWLALARGMDNLSESEEDDTDRHEPVQPLRSQSAPPHRA